MAEERVSIFNRIVNVFKDNIKNLKDERRQRSDLKYSYTDIILGAFSMLYFQNLHITEYPDTYVVSVRTV